MHIVDHPDEFKSGTRVLLLRGRPKDGLPTNRSIAKIVHGQEQFDKRLAELIGISQPGERIYGSAGARDVRKASRLFRERQLASEYTSQSLDFYMKLEARWASCVQAVEAQAEKIWLFDCDSAEDKDLVKSEINEHYDRPIPPYWYPTKSGFHCVVQPFDKSKIGDHARSLIHDNAIILWGW